MSLTPRLGKRERFSKVSFYPPAIGGKIDNVSPSFTSESIRFGKKLQWRPFTNTCIRPLTSFVSWSMMSFSKSSPNFPHNSFRIFFMVDPSVSSSKEDRLPMAFFMVRYPCILIFIMFTKMGGFGYYQFHRNKIFFSQLGGRKGSRIPGFKDSPRKQAGSSTSVFLLTILSSL